jgi:hypothetical protein
VITTTRRATIVARAAVGLVALLAAGALPACAASPRTATVTVDTAHPLGRFSPFAAFGAGLDGQDRGAVSGMYSPANVRAMASAGFKPVTYRLRTELAVEAWHWNPDGTWSDPARAQGYWTSSAVPTRPIELSYGYRLPRRGDTHDQANDDGYSRLDDGDPSTFWKSNPYLDPHFTGAPDSEWVVVDLGRAQPVDTVRLSWATPYAVAYQVDWWDGDDPFSISAGSGETWRSFPNGTVDAGTGGDVELHVGAAPQPVRFVRVLMTRGSGQAPVGSTDQRDGLGYALREISVGTGAGGNFRDAVRRGHTATTQSAITVSSTDPWHRATDIDTQTEQPGFDKVLATGLVNGLPAVVATSLLYGTPEDAQAELSWLTARGFPIGGLELGEEPDGQNALPEDYGRLFVQWARSLHAVRADVRLGGPALQTGFAEVRVWPDAAGETSWLRRLAAYFRSVGALGDFGFLSVEWYPFDDACAPVPPHLRAEPELLAATFRRWASDGLGAVPKLVTEYGYSAFAAEPEVDVTGAIVNTDFAAQFLTLGGTAAFFYGYEPNTLLKEADCNSWGNTMLLQADDDYDITARMPAYFAARLLTQVWAQPVDALHTLYPATVHTAGSSGGAVTAYALRRPDGRWAVLVLNKDAGRAVHLRLTIFRGTVAVTQYGRAQYAWHPAGERGHPTRDLQPVTSDIRAGAAITLPALSMTVVTGVG